MATRSFAEFLVPSVHPARACCSCRTSTSTAAECAPAIGLHHPTPAVPDPRLRGPGAISCTASARVPSVLISPFLCAPVRSAETAPRSSRRQRRLAHSRPRSSASSSSRPRRHPRHRDRDHLPWAMAEPGVAPLSSRATWQRQRRGRAGGDGVSAIRARADRRQSSSRPSPRHRDCVWAVAERCLIGPTCSRRGPCYCELVLCVVCGAAASGSASRCWWRRARLCESSVTSVTSPHVKRM